MITARRIVLLIDRLYELAAAPSVHHEQIPQIAVRVRSAVIVVPSAAGNVPETFDAPFRSDETDPVAVMVMRNADNASNSVPVSSTNMADMRFFISGRLSRRSV